ncbi:MAG: GNAT family N-acetyltransferase [Polyangiaceae bacterium]
MSRLAADPASPALDPTLSFEPNVAIGDALNAIHAMFERSAVRAISIDLEPKSALAPQLARMGVIHDLSSAPTGRITARSSRATFFQRAEPWLVGASSAAFPLRFVMSQGKRHPERPPIPPGVVYRRRIPAIDGIVTLRTITIDGDLDVFHRWMNDPRVAAFWELSGSRELHAEYLERTLADRHVHPVVGCFDGNPFGYFEIYWAKEDRIAPFYDADDYDRGIHMLVGEPRYRGPHRVEAWLPSLVHYLFLDDPRTKNVVAEPRSDNAKMIDYLTRAGFCKTKEFDFPHKRAALMVASREVFFGERCP